MRQQHGTVWSRKIVQNIVRSRRSNPELESVEIEPAGCCVDTDALMVICPDPSNPWHRAQVTSIETISDEGLVTLSFTDASGAPHNARLPMCSFPEEGECCFDAINGVILCDDPSHPWHNKPASLNDDLGNGYVYVCGNLSGSALSCARMPLCPDQPPEGCCYDATTGAVVCDNEMFPHGLTPELIKQGIDDKGKGYVVVRDPALNDGNRTLMYLCPEQPPAECCFDVATGKLSCAGSSFDGLEVSLEHMTDVMEDGNVYAVVSHPDLPGGVGEFMLCDQEVPPECCYDGQQKVLRCPGSALDGTTAGVVTTFDGPDGRPWVSVAWEGGGARMPLCTQECPPSYCCVNLQTGLFVCPGEPDLNGQAADVANVETQDGYNFAVLSDGTQVPVCGSESPPPELCPDCPSCPPGMWMTPDKQCTDVPWGDPCPPGMWRDPDGICRMPPECPECPKYKPGECPKCQGLQDTRPQGYPPVRHWWGSEGACCESCAIGQACGGDCGCGDTTKHANPAPAKGTWYPGSYSNRAPIRGRAWVQLRKGRRRKFALLHVPGEPSYKVRVLKLRKSAGGEYKVLVQGLMAKKKPLRVQVFERMRKAGSLVPRGSKAECLKKCAEYGYSAAKCKSMCSNEDTITSPSSTRGDCTQAELDAGGCYSITHDRCFVPCGLDGTITLPSKPQQPSVRPWAV